MVDTRALRAREFIIRASSSLALGTRGILHTKFMFDENISNKPVEFVVSRAGRPTHFVDDEKSDGFGSNDALIPQAGTHIKVMIEDAFDLSLDNGSGVFFKFNEATIVVNPKLKAKIFTTDGKLSLEAYQELQQSLDKISEELRKAEEENS